MIRGGFLNLEDRRQLVTLARDGSVASRVTRRANALVLLDEMAAIVMAANADQRPVDRGLPRSGALALPRAVIH
jgi:hypothetical protein